MLASKNKIFKTERLNRLNRLSKKNWLIFPALSIVIILMKIEYDKDIAA